MVPRGGGRVGIGGFPTRQGARDGPATSESVASGVLSPLAATKTITKVVAHSFRSTARQRSFQAAGTVGPSAR